MVEDVIFQRFQVGVVHTHWAERWRLREDQREIETLQITQDSRFVVGGEGCVRDLMWCHLSASLPLPETGEFMAKGCGLCYIYFQFKSIIYKRAKPVGFFLHAGVTSLNSPN